MCAYIVGAGMALVHQNAMGLFEMQLLVAKRCFAGASTYGVNVDIPLILP